MAKWLNCEIIDGLLGFPYPLLPFPHVIPFLPPFEQESQNIACINWKRKKKTRKEKETANFVPTIFFCEIPTKLIYRSLLDESSSKIIFKRRIRYIYNNIKTLFFVNVNYHSFIPHLINFYFSRTRIYFITPFACQHPLAVVPRRTAIYRSSVTTFGVLTVGSGGVGETYDHRQKLSCLRCM